MATFPEVATVSSCMHVTSSYDLPAMVKLLADDLAVLPLFAGLPPGDVARIAGLAGVGHAGPRATLVGLQQPGEVVYVILAGSLRVQAEQEDGSLVILGFLGRGDVVGEMSAIDHQARSATVLCLEPCDYAWLGRREFAACLGSMPQLSMNLLRQMSRRLRIADARIQLLARLDVAGRIARQLSVFAAEYGEPAATGGVTIGLRLTQGDLASVVGASRERVNRVLADLKRQGLVTIDDRYRITVVDGRALADRYLL